MTNPPPRIVTLLGGTLLLIFLAALSFAFIRTLDIECSRAEAIRCTAEERMLGGLYSRYAAADSVTALAEHFGTYRKRVKGHTARSAKLAFQSASGTVPLSFIASTSHREANATAIAEFDAWKSQRGTERIQIRVNYATWAGYIWLVS